MAFLTEEEVRHYLGTSAAEIQHLLKRGKLTAYRIGGSYVRFKKEEVIALKSGKKFVAPEQLNRNPIDRLRDVWNFYNFYIVSSVIVLLLAALFFRL